MILRKLLVSVFMVLLAAPACAQNNRKGDRVIEKTESSAPKSRPLEQDPYNAPKSRPLEQDPYNAPKSRPLEQDPDIATPATRGGSGSNGGTTDAVGTAVGILLSTQERSILYDIFGGGREVKGFKKPKPIPPGIRKKIARGGAIPPGIAMTRLPDSALSRLPRRQNQEYLAIGSDIVLIDRSTQVIVDVVEEILR